MRGMIFKKQWLWECDCGANGYEDDKENAQERAFEHRQTCVNGVRRSIERHPKEA